MLEVGKTAPRTRWYYTEGKSVVTNFWRTPILKPNPSTDTHTKVSTNFELMWPTYPQQQLLLFSCIHIQNFHSNTYRFTYCIQVTLHLLPPCGLYCLLLVLQPCKYLLYTWIQYATYLIIFSQITVAFWELHLRKREATQLNFYCLVKNWFFHWTWLS